MDHSPFLTSGPIFQSVRGAALVFRGDLGSCLCCYCEQLKRVRTSPAPFEYSRRSISVYSAEYASGSDR